MNLNTIDILLVKLTRTGGYDYEHNDTVATVIKGINTGWDTISREDYIDLVRWVERKNRGYGDYYYTIVTRPTQEEFQETLSDAIKEAKEDRIRIEREKKKREEARQARLAEKERLSAERERKLFEKLQKKYSKKE